MKRIFQRNCTSINVAKGWLDGEEVRLMLWDTAGQEEFDAITKAYYRGAQACVLAFSTTDRDSFEAAHSWKMKVTGYCEDHILSECGPTRQLDHTVLDHAATETEVLTLSAQLLDCLLSHLSDLALHWARSNVPHPLMATLQGGLEHGLARY
uniref:Uncharacterized protein n=1 Tax=Timema shepardi TaxID=629360 RepID=A0A7R9FVU4_TIMSH|nr:unnamed protein product [Timema shepardi]